VELEDEESDADEPDSAAAVTRHENIPLKQLCSRLRRDLKQVLLFSTADCQVLQVSTVTWEQCAIL